MSLKIWNSQKIVTVIAHIQFAKKNVAIINYTIIYFFDRENGLVLSYDAGWQKRGSCRNYNSKSGNRKGTYNI